MKKPSILFIHKNFPAQFGAFGEWLADNGWDVCFATAREGTSSKKFRVVHFKTSREVTKGIHRYLAGTEAAIIQGQGFARLAISMAADGYRPDIVMAHSGWGVGTFAKDVWPNTKFVPYVEWFYNHPNVDKSPHDSLTKDPIDASARTRVRNTPIVLDLMAADAILCPTRFQADQFPEIWRNKITVVHDGIDTRNIKPAARCSEFLSKFGIPSDAEIVTYVARGMEPQRGFPEMMRAASHLLETRPNLHVIVAGQDRVAYGNRGEAESWKQKMLSELPFDHDRIHFTGLVNRKDLNRIFHASDVHLYLSVPFVLSWSALEAMAAGCHLVAADNAPVHEFMAHGNTATLVDPNDVNSITSGITTVLEEKDRDQRVRKNARDFVVETLDAYTEIFPQKLSFLNQLLH